MAATALQSMDFKTLVGTLIPNIILNGIVPIIFALALIVFLWGVFGFISHAGDEGKRGESIRFMFWGLVGMAIMISVWSLVGLIGGTFFQNTNTIIPQIKL